MSRLSQRRPWMLLPWQTYRVALERPHDYSQSLCDEVQLCPYYRVELVTQLLKETRDLPGLGAGLNTPDEQPWSVLAGRLGSGRNPQNKDTSPPPLLFLNKSSTPRRPRTHQKIPLLDLPAFLCLSQSSLWCHVTNLVPVFTWSATLLWMSHSELASCMTFSRSLVFPILYQL